MQIACLGWGSLVWDPRDLPIRGKWFEDGPLLPIEFARKSKDGRVTLVLVDDKSPVRSLWTLLASENVNTAKAALASREGIPEKNITSDIGFWQRAKGSSGKCVDRISKWAETLALDAVIWTNLGPKFDANNDVPTAEQVIEYLSGLSIEKRRIAQEYIRKAPPQIDTEYRRQIMLKLNWLYE